MINISLDIHIRANREVVWAYMSDILLSLAHNRLHREIIPKGSSHARKGREFVISHRTFLGTHDMHAIIQECIPWECIQIHESFQNPRTKGFLHTCTFHMTPSSKGTKLIYTLEGTFGNLVQNIMYKPIARGIMLEELFRIKHAIESAEPTLDLKAQQLKPI
ncbi:MAG: SRPBCC family protein [Candidatus Marinimicrobia bacterium]|nr:SRPBCC family protein [Candidatus Neomarinimicrobiota bacterium]